MKKLFLVITCLISISNIFGQIFLPLELDYTGVPKSNLSPSSSCQTCFDLLPATNAGEASLIWSGSERWNFLNNASVMGNSESGSAFVDIVSDYLGPIRFALATTISATEDDTSNVNSENIERFLSGGGSAILTTTLIGPTIKSKSNGAYIALLVSPKIGFDFPALGSSVSDESLNVDAGVDLRLNIPLANNSLGILGNYRLSKVFGGESFYQSLGLDKNESFSYSQLSVGLTIPQLNLAIMWNKSLTGPEQISDFHENGRISLTVSPK